MHRSRDRSRFDTGAPLLAQATAALGGIQPLHYWDFATNRALFAGADVGAVSNTPGWSFARASVGTAEDLAGNIIQFASGEVRRTNRGVLIEDARTNLFLNSAVGVTQNVTVAAVAHTLSLRGTGTITLTGVSTAGPLVGTGAANRVALTFTPTAGTLTLTISGAVTNVQLEAGGFASSWIPTAGTSVARAADVLGVSSPGVTYPLSQFVEFDQPVDIGASSRFLQIDATNNESSQLVGFAALTDFYAQVVVAGAEVGASYIVGSFPLNTPARAAMRVAVNDARGAAKGVLGAQDSTLAAPATPTNIRFGASATGSLNVFAYIRRAAYFNSAINDAGLQAMTT